MAWSRSEWGSKARKENGRHTRAAERDEALAEALDEYAEGSEFTPAELYEMNRRRQIREAAQRTEDEWTMRESDGPDGGFW